MLREPLKTSKKSHNNDQLFITNKFVRDFSFIGESIGLERVEFAKIIGLSLADIDEPQGIVPKNYLINSYNTLLEFSDDEFLGAGMSKLPRGTVALMVKSACLDVNLEQALESVAQVLKVSQSTVGLHTIVDDSLVRIQFLPDVKDPRFYDLICSLFIYVCSDVLSVLIKKEIPLAYAYFSCSDAINVSDYQYMFDCPIAFNKPQCEIAFDKSILKQPIRCNYQKVKQYLEVPLSLAKYKHETLDFIRQIKDFLANSPNAQFPSQQQLAQNLGMSVRTLQRKLADENNSYMEIKDTVRQRKATFYLEHTEKNINEVAEKCGFSEMASFTRAFTRWTGTTPSRYNKLI
ncbi:helix-turn-helix domain-containing protein [Thalassotalea psychrophila]|uniref:Helix-turn-helix domain-containing protein n=1 Tax=Thalassotalea psychrophila TaxID=3065647 RepID=A0ABY9TZ69_9GAMM|nr:helix-turn-helix domain-containing protein [Colwelliaceae bacterium SQ149]